jgi:hypothetical protein
MPVPMSREERSARLQGPRGGLVAAHKASLTDCCTMVHRRRVRATAHCKLMCECACKRYCVARAPARSQRVCTNSREAMPQPIWYLLHMMAAAALYGAATDHPLAQPSLNAVGPVATSGGVYVMMAVVCTGVLAKSPTSVLRCATSNSASLCPPRPLDP